LLAAGLVASFAASITAFAGEQAYTTLGAKVFWNQMQYLGDAPHPALLLAFVLVYVGYDLSWRHYAALFALPVLTFVAVLTEPLHLLFWGGVSLGEVGGYVVLSNQSGPLYWLFVFYAYAFSTVAISVLTIAAVDSSDIRRRHLVALTVGSLLPGIAGIAYIFQLGPTPTPNYTGYSYLGTAAAYTYAVHRHDMFTLVPIARRTVFQQMDVGVVTIDSRGLVASANSVAETYLCRDESDIVGRPGPEVLDRFLTDLDLDGETRQKATVMVDDRAFDVTIRPLERSDATIGQLVILDDETQRHRRAKQLTEQNQQLELLNKLIRHDIRNDANLIVEFSRRLSGDSIDEDGPTERDDRYVEGIEDAGERIFDHTESARELMEVISQLSEELHAVELEPTLERAVAEATTVDPDATIRLATDVPTGAVRGNEMLGALFYNLLTNAIQHNDSETPHVVVAVDCRADDVAITVADNGPGIPPDRVDAVFEEGVTFGDTAGTGFGLYLVRALVDQYDGHVSVTDADQLGGVAITVTLPFSDMGPSNQQPADVVLPDGHST
jgi:signal transduction histidine kinase